MMILSSMANSALAASRAASRADANDTNGSTRHLLFWRIALKAFFACRGLFGHLHSLQMWATEFLRTGASEATS